ncbi:MOSC domain-containing protein [Hymenobacter busanensis]|uniref:MOSC domain-containing protein n=1 Tax=Hymenobacter busanensis TaxID=2607656 RepID=A0A7L4ZUY4_9BACT|nr:MOSC N-terminal beta barrel domain-containing protein [Hymenobacter busanensis]KAA9332419.1 MOSC domain-containing protein [Hymenobacter busanensis]QHJ07244.1 MOSC domain-containing protein [Hymenobacter busanensis]
MPAASLLLADLYLYPVKSLGGFRVPEAEVQARGFRHDRRWLIVDARGQFLTQRNIPEMALLHLELGHNGFVIRHIRRPELRPLLVPFEASADRTQFVTVWDDMVFAYRGTNEQDQWLSEALGQPCRLVFMPDVALRPVDDGKVPGLVSFADAYPFLLIGQASLDDLNQRLEQPLPMNRFRPNLVVTGTLPYAEDTWHEFRVGELAFRGIRPCGRCPVTTTDQLTAERSAEPLRTLAQYRKAGNKVMFGMNVVGPASGVLRTGGAVEVLSHHA